jgi:hypothetical protein
MRKYKFIVWSLLEGSVIGIFEHELKFDWGTKELQKVRTEARKAASIDLVPYTEIQDPFENRILYTKKHNRLVQIVEANRYAAGDYLKDPITLMYDTIKLNTAKARTSQAHSKERSRRRHQAARIVKQLTLDGEEVTTQNARAFIESRKAKIKAARQEEREAWKVYDAIDLRTAATIEKHEKEIAALKIFIHSTGGDLPKTNTYTAREAARKMQAAKPLPTAAPAPQTAPQTAPAAPEEPKGAFFDPAKYQLIDSQNPAPSAGGMNPEDCDFI